MSRVYLLSQVKSLDERIGCDSNDQRDQRYQQDERDQRVWWSPVVKPLADFDGL